jgi:hypothetical protein
VNSLYYRSPVEGKAILEEQILGKSVQTHVCVWLSAEISEPEKTREAVDRGRGDMIENAHAMRGSPSGAAKVFFRRNREGEESQRGKS